MHAYGHSSTPSSGVARRKERSVGYDMAWKTPVVSIDLLDARRLVIGSEDTVVAEMLQAAQVPAAQGRSRRRLR